MVNDEAFRIFYRGRWRIVSLPGFNQFSPPRRLSRPEFRTESLPRTTMKGLSSNLATGQPRRKTQNPNGAYHE